MEQINADIQNRDPIKLYEQYLLENAVCDEAYFDDVKQKCSDTIDEAVRKAAAAPLPTMEDVYQKSCVYTMPETGGDL